MYQGSDTVEQVREVLLAGLASDHTVIAEPTGSHIAGGNPEWKITGPITEVLVVILNYTGVSLGTKNELGTLFTLLEIDSDDSFDATRKGD